MVTQQSPFKFLAPFDHSDRNAFFGREAEIETLYELMFQTQLLLIFGLSGTGKTSLVRCGLASRFKGQDWTPIYIRRDNDINQAIRQNLQVKMGLDRPWAGINDAVLTIFKDWWRPVYLIFDQLEEVFTIGSSEERELFAQNLRALLDANLKCKVLLVMREEFIGRLKELEPILPEVFDFTNRVDVMGDAIVESVITKSCALFNISLQPDPSACCARIIANLKVEDENTVRLPYLQIYLDFLYKEAFNDAYPNGIDSTPGTKGFPPVTFQLSKIEHLGKIEHMLVGFLDKLERDTLKELKRTNPKVPPQTFIAVLDLLVTQEGTRNPVFFQNDPAGNIVLHLSDPQKETMLGLSDKIVSDTLKLLQEQRLVRITENKIELSHDTIAKPIELRRAGIKEIKTRIEAVYKEWQNTNGKVYLNSSQLNNMEMMMPKVQPLLAKDVKDFVALSKSRVRRKWAAGSILFLIFYPCILWGIKYFNESENTKEKIGRLSQLNQSFVEKALWPYVYELKYLEVKSVLDSTQNPENNGENVTSLYFELAYFFNESGHLGLAKSCAEKMIGLDSLKRGRSPEDRLGLVGSVTRNRFRDFLKKLEPERFDSMEIRYFPQMRPVKGGNFTFGCLEGKTLTATCPRIKDVRVPEFEMAETEATMWQYAIYAASLDVQLDTLHNNWRMRGDNPIADVSWNDAARYANWVSKRHGLDTAYVFVRETSPGVWLVAPNPKARNFYRLPKEVEWEYAAKGGGMQQPFLFAGSDSANLVAWYRNNSQINGKARAHKVASKLPNPAGLYDMSGNVWEWCEDGYVDNKRLKINPDNSTTPGPGIKFGKRVTRGGSFAFDITSAWVITRGSMHPELKGSNFGFRLVRVKGNK